MNKPNGSPNRKNFSVISTPINANIKSKPAEIPKITDTIKSRILLDFIRFLLLQVFDLDENKYHTSPFLNLVLALFLTKQITYIGVDDFFIAI